MRLKIARNERMTAGSTEADGKYRSTRRLAWVVVFVYSVFSVWAVKAPSWLQNFFDNGFREANLGHFDLHWLSLLLVCTILVLSAALIVALKWKTVAMLSIVLLSYPPVYLLSGKYLVASRPIDPSVVTILALAALSLVMSLLVMYYRAGDRAAIGIRQ